MLQESFPELTLGIRPTDTDYQKLQKSVKYGKGLCNEITALTINVDSLLNDLVYKKLLKIQKNVAAYRKNMDNLAKNKLAFRKCDTEFSAKYRNREMIGSLKNKIQVRFITIIL